MGKTLTMLTVIAFMNTPKTHKKTLIIVPNGSLVQVWRNEAETRCDMSRIGKIVRYKQFTPSHAGTSPVELESASIM